MFDKSSLSPDKDENCCWQCRISPTLPPPKLLTRAPLMVIYKKSYVMLNIEAEWTSKQNILIADTILAEPGP